MPCGGAAPAGAHYRRTSSSREIGKVNKFTIAGIAAFLGGGVLLGFQAISTLMETEGAAWKQISLLDIFDPSWFSWIDTLSWTLLRHTADYLVSMPLFLLLFGIGTFAFLLNAIFGR